MKQILAAYIKKHKNYLYLSALFLAIFASIFYLYNLPLQAVLYGALLCSFTALVAAGFSFARFSRRHRQLHRLKKEITLTLEHLPEPAHALEGLYLELLHILFAEQALFKSDAEQKRAGLQNYYTLWAHQIKTPIAAMSLLLQNNPGHINAELEAELFKIERCVEMVLHYLRIESPSSDFVFQYYKLDNLVRPIIRRYAKLFIHKKISLKMDNLEIEILTDAKWLSFALEQILSNALKYTEAGRITIKLEQVPGQGLSLAIADTGCGIHPEDLPRIFEKGFTGFRGRVEQKSTGIGLYLSKLVLDRLGHPMTVDSVLGKGTAFKIGLQRSPLADRMNDSYQNVSLLQEM